MRDRLEAAQGLWLRRWSSADAGSVLTAFADPLMAWQADESISSPAAAERWLAARTGQWDSGSGFAFAVVDEADTVLGNCRTGRRQPLAARASLQPPAVHWSTGPLTKPDCSVWSWVTGSTIRLLVGWPTLRALLWREFNFRSSSTTACATTSNCMHVWQPTAPWPTPGAWQASGDGPTRPGRGGAGRPWRWWPLRPCALGPRAWVESAALARPQDASRALRHQRGRPAGTSRLGPFGWIAGRHVVMRTGDPA